MNLRFGVLWPFRNPAFNKVPWEQLYRSHLDLISASEGLDTTTLGSQSIISLTMDILLTVSYCGRFISKNNEYAYWHLFSARTSS